MPGGVHHIPFPTLTGGSVEESLRALSYVFAADMPPEDVAAIILEPVQGEGGFHVAPRELLTALRDICDRHGIVLVADEVQRSEEHTSELQSLMRISYAVFCLKKTKRHTTEQKSLYKHI